MTDTIDTVLQAVTTTPQTTAEIQAQTGFCNKTVVNTLLILAASGKIEEMQEPWRGRFKFIRKWRRV